MRRPTFRIRRPAPRWVTALAVVALVGVLGAPSVSPRPSPREGVAMAPSPAVIAPIVERAAPSLAAPAPGSLTWSRLAPSAPGLSLRESSAIAYDPVGNFTLLFGGGVAGASAPVATLNDTWELSHRVWTNVTGNVGPAPPPREFAILVYDVADGYFVLYGGFRPSASGPGTDLNDTWTFSGQRWSNVTTSAGPAPSRRFAPSGAYDARISALVLFGGSAAPTGRLLNDTWEFAAGKWSDVTAGTVGRDPPPREQAALGFDVTDNLLLLYGGYDPGNSTVLNDTWRFSGGVWTLIEPPASPGPLRGASMAPGGSSGRYPILFGGVTSSGNASNRTWEFDRGLWVDLTASLGGSPGDRAFGAMAWDSGDQFSVVTSGLLYGPASSTTETNDTWVLATTAAVLLVANSSSVDTNQSLPLTAIATSGSPPLTFRWTNLPPGCRGANVSFLPCVPTGTGSFTISVTLVDALGFSAAADAYVTVYAFPNETVDWAPTAGAAPLHVVFHAAISGGLAPFTVTWHFGDGASATGVDADHSYPSGGSFTVTEWANDSIGASARGGATVEVYPAFSATLTIGPARAGVDLGGTANLSVAASGGLPSYRYAWEGLPSGCLGTTGPSLDCRPTSTGTFPITVVVNDSGGDSVRAGGVLQVHPTLGVSTTIVPATSCGAGPVNLTAILAGGAPPYTVDWHLPDGATATGISTVQVFLPGGVESVHVAVHDGAGGEANGTASVSLPACTGASTGSPAVLEVGVGLAVAAAAVGAFLFVRGRRRDGR